MKNDPIRVYVHPRRTNSNGAGRVENWIPASAGMTREEDENDKVEKNKVGRLGF